MISKEIYNIVMENAELLDSSVIYDRDFHYNLYVTDVANKPDLLNRSRKSALASRPWNDPIF
jgi:ribonucleoside-diphosphate reductase subunit M1